MRITANVPDNIGRVVVECNYLLFNGELLSGLRITD
jgi:hypothetical protein